LIPLPQIVYHDSTSHYPSSTHGPHHIYFSPAKIRSRISLPYDSASAAPAALPLPIATPLMAELSCLCSTSLPSACFSFFDLPEKAPEIAPKRFRFSCGISQLWTIIHHWIQNIHRHLRSRSRFALFLHEHIVVVDWQRLAGSLPAYG
jgi:hypothetical protein